MALLAAIFFGFVPMFFFAMILYSLDRFEKEPLVLLAGVFLWGMVVAAGGAFVLNTLFGLTVYSFTGSADASDLATASISAPFIEEGLKGAAVLLVFLLFRQEFDSVLDGIIYAGITALGFAATENVLYIWRGYASGGWGGLFQLVFVRVVLVGWQHPVYTAFTGIGLGVSRLSRSCLGRAAAPLLGLGMAIFTHALHNTLAGTQALGQMTCFVGTFLDWSGAFFMFALVLWANWMESRNITNQLRQEVELGIISPAQYRTAASAFAQWLARATGLLGGGYRATDRFYQVCGRLALKKQQYARLGDEAGSAALIQTYRAELARLAPLARD